MNRSFVGVLLAALLLSWSAGCGGDSIVKGTTPVTSIAPSHPIPYPVGPGGDRGPPSPKDLLKGKVPGGKVPPR